MPSAALGGECKQPRAPHAGTTLKGQGSRVSLVLAQERQGHSDRPGVACATFTATDSLHPLALEMRWGEPGDVEGSAGTGTKVSAKGL